MYIICFVLFELNILERIYFSSPKLGARPVLKSKVETFRAEDLRGDGEQEDGGGGDQDHVQPVRTHRGLHRAQGRQRHQQRWAEIIVLEFTKLQTKVGEDFTITEKASILLDLSTRRRP